MAATEKPPTLLLEERFAADVAAVANVDVVPNILEVICRATGMGFSAVARVTEDRWIACAVRDEIAFGLTPGGELQIKTTICNEIRQSGRLVVIDQVSADADFCHHPTPEMYGFQSYISVPINLPDGQFFGTLCAIDPKPAQLRNPGTIGMFELFANLIGLHLDTQARLARTESALLDEQERRELREQFIAVLGHDLRNPLSAVQAGAKLLRATATDERSSRMADVISRSAERMAGLIDNVLDFARGRLTGGLPVAPVVEADLAAAFEEVITEMRTARPECTILHRIDLPRPFVCDRARLAQLLSNLLANALTHGEATSEVWVRARMDDAGVEISVANQGNPIPPGLAARLFQPFVRASDRPNRQGLGLGLYIAAEIARAHGGTLEVTSSADETRFTCRLPAARP